MFLLLLCLSISVTLSACCDEGFVSYGDSCYVVLPELGTWLTAMEYCKAFGMNLVVVQSPGEYNFLKDYLYTHKANFSHSPDFWTAGSHMMSAEWAWAGTDEEIETFYWGPGEPNSPAVERCLAFYERKNFTWDDEYCSYIGYPLCEKKLQLMPGS